MKEVVIAVAVIVVIMAMFPVTKVVERQSGNRSNGNGCSNSDKILRGEKAKWKEN